VPFGWKSWMLWQYAADRPIQGVEKTADVSMLHPSMDIDLLAPRNE